jgi:dTDP-glucose 4,6-dehydratase
MRILVTGSEGTLGKPLARELTSRGHDVYGCDLTHNENNKIIRADVTNLRQLQKAFTHSEPDLVYHLAAEFGRHNGEQYYEQLWNTNQVGTQNVINLCLRHKSRFVLAGSSEAYGESNQRILHEEWLDVYKPNFYNQYALSKWAQEQQTFIAALNSKLNAVVLRFFNAYGEGEYYNPFRSVVCLFCYRLMHGLPITVYENYHRVFMHVDDWARTVANVADRFDSLPRRNNHFYNTPIYNIGGTEYRSVQELATIIMNQLGYAGLDRLVTVLPKENANVTNKRPDVSLAHVDLGHNPTITLEEGVTRTITWMNKVYFPGAGHLDVELERRAA